MGKIKNALKVAVNVAEKYAERQAEIRKLTRELMDRTCGVDYEQAEKIATMLHDRAEPIVWK